MALYIEEKKDVFQLTGYFAFFKNWKMGDTKQFDSDSQEIGLKAMFFQLARLRNTEG